MSAKVPTFDEASSKQQKYHIMLFLTVSPMSYFTRISVLALAWLKTNFLKTELELGRCLRLPQEGPCECDLYLTCAKFVTTPEYAPRLRHRRNIELDLIEDASARGWQREVERHQCIVNRLEQLLVDLAEPLDGPGATG